MRALLAEDDFALRDAIFRLLREAQFEVTPLVDGKSALHEATRSDFDIAVVDIGLPKLSGLEVIRAVRAAASDVPIIIITGLGAAADVVAGLDAGADDYLVKPFRLIELEARIHALIRRRRNGWAQRLAVGPLQYDRKWRSFTAHAQPLHLSRRESEILAILMEHPSELVRKDLLVRRLSHWDQTPSGNLIEVYIHKLRKRLATLGIEIQTVRGLGYILHDSAPSAESAASER